MYSLYTYVIKYHNSNNILPIYAYFSSILIAEGEDWPIGGSVKAYAYLLS